MRFDRILIAGAGGIGSVMGAMLRARGHRVTLIGRRAHLAAISRAGLSVSGILGERTAAGFELATDPAGLSGQFPLILFTVKSYDTEAMAAAIAERLAERGVIVAMQNGLGNIEALAARFGKERVLGARVIFGAEIRAPGSAHVTVIAEPVAVGPWPAFHGGASGALLRAAEEVAAMLDQAGVPARAQADIMPAIWAKLLYNAALNPLGALLGLNYGALAADPDLRPIMDAAIGEAFAVARGLNVELAYRDADDYRAAFYGKLIPPTQDHFPSMLYDLERRGRTEIGALNGRIAELAGQMGLGAEVNRILTRLIRARERSQSGMIARRK